MKKLYIFALVAMLFATCTTGETQDVAVNIEAPDTIYATFDEAEADSRTYVEQGKYLRWNEGDEISFFPVTYNMQYRFKGKTGDNNGAFEKITTDLVTGNELKNNYAVYPYKASTAMSDEGIISFELPAVQHYAENSFGVGANTMVAITSGKDDNILRFKNCGGYLKLQLYGDATVKSIELKGNNGEKIAGASTITAVYGGEPSVAMADSATTSITLDCDDGVALGATADAATAFWFVVPPTTFENGFTVTVTNTEGAIFEKSTSNTTTIDRNTIQPMAEVEVKCANPENCKIYYISTEKIEKSSWSNETFGANIVSNEWDETTGKGVITFDGEVTKIGKESFFYLNSLISITIPDSVTEIGYQTFYSCNMLQEVHCKPATPPTGGSNMFSYDYNTIGCTIYVPTESVEAYKAAKYWSNYANYIFGNNFETPITLPSTGIYDNALDSNKYLVYVANKSTAFAVTSSRDYNVWETYFENKTGGSVAVAEYKFQLPEVATNWTPISDDSIEIKDSSIRILIEYDNYDERYYYSYFDFSSFGVEPTEVITLRIDKINKVVSINGYTMEGTINRAMSSLVFSSYYSEWDEGQYRDYSGIIEGTKLYYAKGWDMYGRLLYLGYASTDTNQDTGNVEACWKSQAYAYNSIIKESTFANNRYLKTDYVPLGMGNLQ